LFALPTPPRHAANHRTSRDNGMTTRCPAGEGGTVTTSTRPSHATPRLLLAHLQYGRGARACPGSSLRTGGTPGDDLRIGD
jgi:hypothetical protein